MKIVLIWAIAIIVIARPLFAEIWMFILICKYEKITHEIHPRSTFISPIKLPECLQKSAKLTSVTYWSSLVRIPILKDFLFAHTVDVIHLFNFKKSAKKFLSKAAYLSPTYKPFSHNFYLKDFHSRKYSLTAIVTPSFELPLFILYKKDGSNVSQFREIDMYRTL